VPVRGVRPRGLPLPQPCQQRLVHELAQPFEINEQCRKPRSPQPSHHPLGNHPVPAAIADKHRGHPTPSSPNRLAPATSTPTTKQAIDHREPIKETANKGSTTDATDSEAAVRQLRHHGPLVEKLTIRGIGHVTSLARVGTSDSPPAPSQTIRGRLCPRATRAQTSQCRDGCSGSTSIYRTRGSGPSACHTAPASSAGSVGFFRRGRPSGDWLVGGVPAQTTDHDQRQQDDHRKRVRRHRPNTSITPSGPPMRVMCVDRSKPCVTAGSIRPFRPFAGRIRFYLPISAPTRHCCAATAPRAPPGRAGQRPVLVSVTALWTRPGRVAPGVASRRVRHPDQADDDRTAYRRKKDIDHARLQEKQIPTATGT
jgi:hypothetical protein